MKLRRGYGEGVLSSVGGSGDIEDGGGLGENAGERRGEKKGIEDCDEEESGENGFVVVVHVETNSHSGVYRRNGIGGVL